MDLNEIYIFIKVVELGSFSGAARRLGMPNSTVSAKIASLEKRLGTTLIQRTTRRIVVTPAGRRFFERCAGIIRELLAAETELTEDRTEPRGRLRITAPVELGNSVLPQLLTEFLAKFSRVTVEAILVDRRVNLVEDGVDLALRAGELDDSTLIVRKVAAVGFGVFASPEFVNTFGQPRAPADIASFQTIAFTPLARKAWSLVGPDGEVEVEGPSRYTLNDLGLVKTMARRGVGLVLLPTFYCATEVAAGELVRVLPAWTTRPAPLQFVYPAQKFVPARVSAFIEMAVPRLREILEIPSA